MVVNPRDDVDYMVQLTKNSLKPSSIRSTVASISIIYKPNELSNPVQFSDVKI